MLAAEQRIPHDYEVPCQIVTEAEAIAASLSENRQRENMHPVDEAQAFADLVRKQKKKPAAVALLYGVPKRYVHQRLALADVHPQILEAARLDDMDLDTLQAYTITKDQQKQLAAFEELGPNASQWSVRRFLTAEAMNVESALVRFVGVDAYREAGGTFAEDLFSDDDPALLTDVALLRKLAAAKLKPQLKALKAEGWKWAEIDVEGELLNLDCVEPSELKATDEQQAEIDALNAELTKIMEQDTITEEEDARVSAIEARLSEIDDALFGFSDEQKAFSGAFVYLNYFGAVAMRRGVVRKEDEPALEEWEASQKAAAVEARAEAEGFGIVVGNGETEDQDEDDQVPIEGLLARERARNAATRARCAQVQKKIRDVAAALEIHDSGVAATVRDVLREAAEIIDEILIEA